MVALDVRVRRLRLRETFTTSHGSSDERGTVIVRLDDGHGLSGYGEATPYYDETIEGVAAELTMASRDGLALEALVAEGPAALAPSGKLAAHALARVAPSSRSALVMAALDLEGQRRGLPVATMLGGDAGRDMVTSFTLGQCRPEEMGRRASAASEFRVLKVKVGSALDEESLAAVRAARPDAVIRVDANGGWGEEDAIRRLSALARFGVELCEQPVAADDPEALRRVAAASALPVYADESVRCPQDVARLSGVHGIVIKLGKCGGIDRALACALAARERGVEVMIGCMIESSVGITAAAHLAPLCDRADLDGNLLVEVDPYRGVRVEGGMLRLSDAAGLGVRPRG